MDTGRGKLVAVAVTSVSCNSQSKVQRLKRKPQTDRQQSVLEQETAGVIILCSPRQLSSIITGRGWMKSWNVLMLIPADELWSKGCQKCSISQWSSHHCLSVTCRSFCQFLQFCLIWIQDWHFRKEENDVSSQRLNYIHFTINSSHFKH